jgi:hypothetical protein
MTRPDNRRGCGRRYAQKRARIHMKTQATLGNVPSPVMDIRAGVVGRYQQQVGGAELPVPAEVIADGLCRIAVEELDDLDVSCIPHGAKGRTRAYRRGRR